MKQTDLTTLAAPSAHILALDGVRGLAVLAVLVFHTLPIPDYQSPGITLWNAIVKSCWVGVDLFFVLSGFLITRVLCEAKGESNYFRNFYVRRALRIAPLYFSVLLVAIYLLPSVVPASKLPPFSHRLVENQLWAWTFTQNFLQARAPHLLPGLGHLWTLAVEEQFYLIWPAVIYLLSPRRLFLASLVTCALQPLARLLCLQAGFSTWSVRQLTYLRLDSLLFGALLYLLLTRKALPSLSPSRFSFLLRGLTVSALAALGFVFWQHAYLPYDGFSNGPIGYSAVAILSAALLYAAITNRFRAATFFSSPLLRWFGKYSYGIYIFSIPALLGYQAFLAPRIYIHEPFMVALSRLLFAGLLSTSLAFLSWHLLEAPTLRLKSRFLDKTFKLVLAPASLR